MFRFGFALAKPGVPSEIKGILRLVLTHFILVCPALSLSEPLSPGFRCPGTALEGEGKIALFRASLCLKRFGRWNTVCVFNPERRDKCPADAAEFAAFQTLGV